MTNGVRSKLTPFYLKFIAARTITKCEYQAIKLADHTHHPSDWLIRNPTFLVDGTELDETLDRFEQAFKLINKVLQ